MNDEFQPDSAGSSALLKFFIALSLILGLILIYRSVGNPNEDAVDERQAKAEEIRSALQAEIQKQRDEQAALEKQAELNRLLPWKTLLDQTTRTNESLKQVTELLAAINVKIDALKSSPQGRVVAQNETQLAAYRSAARQAASITPEVDGLRNDANAMTVELQSAITAATDSTPPTEEVIKEVTELSSKVAKLRADAASVSAILEGFAGSDVPTVSGPTLASVLAEREEQEKARYLEQEAAALAKLREEEMQKTLAARLQQEREKIEAERKRKMDEAALEAARIESEARAARLAAEQEKRDAEERAKIAAADEAMKRDLPKIRSLLTPFITKSTVQITANEQRVVVEEPQPASWAAIQGSKALDPTSRYYWRSFVNSLVSAGRERGGTPTGEYDYEGVGQAQLLLKKHGEAMVRAGLLAP